MRKGWIYHADGTVSEKWVHREGQPDSKGPYIAADEGEFVSPIDGKTYSGRAGMREHCRIHNVVNNRDLQGLPPATVNTPYVPDRQAIKSAIIESMKRKGYL